MDIGEARRLLGIEFDATKYQVRSAFRRDVVNLHPDVVGAAGSEPTRQLLNAYRIALDAAPDRAESESVTTAVSNGEFGGDPCTTRSEQPSCWLIDTDTIALSCSHDEAFVRLLDVGSALGAITYLDRQGELLEVLLRTKLGDTLSLVVSFQGRSDWVEAFFTSEVLDVARHDLPRIDQLTELVLHELLLRW